MGSSHGVGNPVKSSIRFGGEGARTGAGRATGGRATEALALAALEGSTVAEDVPPAPAAGASEEGAPRGTTVGCEAEAAGSDDDGSVGFAATGAGAPERPK